MKKSYTILVIMIAVSVVCLAVGVLVVRKRIQEAQESQTTTTTDSAPATTDTGTKTYVNNEFGFQFDYTSDFSDPTNVNLTGTPATDQSNYFVLNLVQPPTGQTSAGLTFNIQPLAADEINLNLDDLVTRHSANVASQTDFTLGNETAVKTTFTAAGVISMGSTRSNVTNADVIWARHDDNLMWIQLPPNLSSNSQENDLVNAVLGSVQFMETASSNPASSDNSSTTGTNNSNSSSNTSTNSSSTSTATNPPPAGGVQSVTINVDDSSATPANVIVPTGTIVDLTFQVASENVSNGGLNFQGGGLSTGVLTSGSAKTIAFTATQSFSFSPVWGNGQTDPNYTIQIMVTADAAPPTAAPPTSNQ